MESEELGNVPVEAVADLLRNSGRPRRLEEQVELFEEAAS